MSDHDHTQGNDLAVTDKEATTPPLKSALNQPPKDNQIDEILAKVRGWWHEEDQSVHAMPIDEAKAALATAIGQSLPKKTDVRTTKIKNRGDVWLIGKAEGRNEALDQFVEALRGLGLNL